MQAYSYVARIRARSGVLLGGTKVHSSSRMENYTMALKWAATIVENNRIAGREPVYSIKRVELEPEIMEEATDG